MTVRVRPLLPGDKPAVMSILQATREFEPAEVQVAGELIDYYLAEGNASGYHVLTAEADGTIAGYVCYGPTPLTQGVWDVYWIAVIPEKKGQGTGTALMAAVEDQIKQSGGRMVLIETSSVPSYEMTRRFYYRIGCHIICQIPDFYKPGDSLVVFQKRFD